MNRDAEPKEQNKNTPAMNQASNEIVVETGRVPSLAEEALIDFGKDLVKGSITTSMEFHKTMLSLTTSFATFMVSYFGILAFGLKGDQPLDKSQRFLLIIPVLLMIASGLCFALGYYPRYRKMVLNDLTEISDARERLLKTRRSWAIAGTTLFALSLIALLCEIVILNINIKVW